MKFVKTMYEATRGAGDFEYNPYDDKYKNTQENIIDDNIK